MKFNRKQILSLLLLFQIIALQILTFFPQFVEQFYSNDLYPILSKISRSSLGWIPFSVGDIIYGSLIVWAIYWFYKNRKESWKTKGLVILGTISIVYFLFYFLWALNYYRLPLYEKMNLKTDYTQEQLIQFTKKLIVKTNQIHFEITKDTAKKVVSPYNTKQIFNLAPSGYSELKKVHSFFNYEKPSIKNSTFKTALSYSGVGGYLNPFTNEAQVNSLIPLYNLPATTSHEMAHQMGYANETECNFIGFLAAIHNKDLHFQYAGYTYALRYCLSNIGTKDEKQLEKMLKTLNPGILKNFRESEEFYEKYNSFLDTIFEFVYDNFLKMNQQKDGMESYSKFVDLLVNYYDGKDL